MSISAPSNPYAQLSQPAVRWEVWIGDEQGNPPARFQPQPVGYEPMWFPVTASQVAGGTRDEVLTIATKLPAPVIDNTLSRYLGRQVEVYAIWGDGTSTLIGWGFICRKPVLIDQDTETYSFEARIGDEHFGRKVETIPVWDVKENARRDVMWSMMFNPEIDGDIEPNMSSRTDADHEWHYVLNPESIRTQASRTLQQQTAGLWKLSDAVLAICWWLNPDEKYIRNPTSAAVRGAFGERNETLKNVEIPMGSSLPEALDLLLSPLEYGWYLGYGLDYQYQRTTTIFFFRRGFGQNRSVLMQRPGSVRDIRQTQVMAFDTTVNNVELSNRVLVYGDFEKRELTIELVKGWDQQYDAKRLSDLNPNAPFAKDHPEVGRKWVLNEAGDYIDLRPEITSPADLSGLFAAPLMLKRRRFLRCLSQHLDADDRESNGYRVEWYNRHAPGAVDPTVKSDPGWTVVTWAYSVLEKECGILFDDIVSPQLWSPIHNGNPSAARIRITATIAGDLRVKGDAVRRDSSPNLLDIVLTLMMSDKFEDSRIDSSTKFGSIFRDRPTDARNDTTAIQQYAEQVRDIEDVLQFDLTIPLEGGFHPEYQIGNVIGNVSGRNISLQQGRGRFPQVVGIVHHFQRQQVELLLESFRQERPRIVLSNNERLVVGAESPTKKPHFRKPPQS